jgi:CheY-like chemotaxis protein
VPPVATRGENGLLERDGELALIGATVSRLCSGEGALVDALEVGADDYVTRPLRPGELLARPAARLRVAPSRLRVEADGVVIDLSAMCRSGQR